MRVAQLLLEQRQPMIRFLGKRSPPKCKGHLLTLPALIHTQDVKACRDANEDCIAADHSPHVHPASPSNSLPDSFASYRQRAQQHGPLGPTRPSSMMGSGRSGASLGPVQPAKGQYFDRDELPVRFRRTAFTPEEIDAIETGGASLHA